MYNSMWQPRRDGWSNLEEVPSFTQFGPAQVDHV